MSARDLGESFSIDVRYYRLSKPLQPYFTALYSFAIDCDDDVMVRDLLHPEWSVLRFTASGSPPIAAIVPEPIKLTYPCVASGPTSQAISFGLGKSRIWGLGLQPAGWARYIDAPASALANRIVDAGSHSAFGLFAPILEMVQVAESDTDETARSIDAYLMKQEVNPPAPLDQILACQTALRDPEIADVQMLADAIRVGRRTLERLCGRYFGFPPKLLLRRQRFLRSLARFMLEPKHNWSKALDGQYFDQAHFVRDFRSFMGMTPSEYAETPHPVIDRIMAQRMADQGAAPETDFPTVVRYAGKGSSNGESSD